MALPQPLVEVPARSAASPADRLRALTGVTADTVLEVGLTLASGLLYAASFPPLSLSWCSWVALAPWMVACSRSRPSRAAALGMFWGLVVAPGVAPWLPAMIGDYLEVSGALAWLGALAVAITLFGWYFAVFGAWLAWACKRRVASPLLIAAAWAGCELGRCRLLGGNPWALLGYTQIDAGAVVQIADVVGVYGVGALVAAVNASLAGIAAPHLRGRRFFASCAAVLIAVTAAVGYGRWRLSSELPSEGAFEVAVVQGNVERGRAWRPEYRRLGIDHYLRLSAETLGFRPRLVVWPEYALSFYPEEASPEREMLLDSTRAWDADLIFGAPHYTFDASGETIYHNSIYLVRDGALGGRYDKQHLLPVAEAALPGGVADRRITYAPGGDPVVLPAGAARVGAFVCFEAMYPELVATLPRAGAEVLVNVSNDAWFGSAAAARHHLDIARFRAIENRRYLVRAASTGYSAIVSPTGAMVAQGELGQAAVLTARVSKSAWATLYHQAGDAPTLLAALLAALVPLNSVRRASRGELGDSSGVAADRRPRPTFGQRLSGGLRPWL